MAKTFVFVIPAVLLLMYGVCEGLECYHCYTNGKFENKGKEFVPCNEANMTASNTWICPSPTARCLYQVVEVQSTKSQQTWRTCSNGASDPCDPNLMPPGIKMLKCTHCGTDRCNLNESKAEEEKNSFTFNINANVNLYIRQ